MLRDVLPSGDSPRPQNSRHKRAVLYPKGAKVNKCTCGAQHTNEAHSDWCDVHTARFDASKVYLVNRDEILSGSKLVWADPESSISIDLEIPFTAEVWLDSSNVAMDPLLKFQIQQNELLTAYFIAMVEGRLEDAQRLSYLARAMASKSLKA
jgi:hypothetical protein